LGRFDIALTTFGESVFFFGFADLDRGFFATAAGFFRVDSLFEGGLALRGDRMDI
jgi:hypothetical protein